MSFKMKIMKWNLISVVVSLFVTALASLLAVYLLSVKLFGRFFTLEDMLKSPMLGSFAIQLLFITLVVFMLSLLAANLVMYYKITRDLINPLLHLRDGLKEMSVGNFTHTFTHTSMDEIGDITSYIQEVQNRLQTYINQITTHQQNNLELITSISHDLRTPITTILGYTEGILDNVADTPEKKTNYLLKIKNKTIELDNLIDQLLLSAKLDLNKISYQFEPTDLFCYIKDMMDEIKIDFDNNQMALTFTETEGPFFVALDRMRFKRVVLNIVTNSIRYKREGFGQFSVQFQAVADSVVVSFSDDGQGIDKEKLPFIFNSFYRCDDSRQETSSGSGLGLSIARLIVEGHGGKIWARSKAGEGTTINISLKIL